MGIRFSLPWLAGEHVVDGSGVEEAQGEVFERGARKFGEFFVEASRESAKAFGNQAAEDGEFAFLQALIQTLLQSFSAAFAHGGADHVMRHEVV